MNARLAIARAFLFAIAGLCASAPARAEPTWACDAGGFHVEQTDTDIVARPADTKQPSFSASGLVEPAFAQALRDVRAGDAKTVTVERTLSIVSLLGPLLSLRDEAFVDAQPSAHPGGETRYWTIDLRRREPLNLSPDDPMSVALDKPGPLVDMRSLFPPRDIQKALGNDPFVRRLVQRPPTDLSDLLEAIGNRGAAAPGVCFSVPTDVLTRFALVGFQDGAVLARIGLPGAGPCRYKLTQIGVRLASGPAFDRAVPPAARQLCKPPANLPSLKLRRTVGQ